MRASNFEGTKSSRKKSLYHPVNREHEAIGLHDDRDKNGDTVAHVHALFPKTLSVDFFFLGKFFMWHRDNGQTLFWTSIKKKKKLTPNNTDECCAIQNVLFFKKARNSILGSNICILLHTSLTDGIMDGNKDHVK